MQKKNTLLLEDKKELQKNISELECKNLRLEKEKKELELQISKMNKMMNMKSVNHKSTQTNQLNKSISKIKVTNISKMVQTNRMNESYKSNKITVNKDESNVLKHKIDLRKRKNKIETNYLVVEQLRRDKFVKTIEDNYKKSMISVNNIISDKNNKIVKLNSIINDYKFKINSLEEILIVEGQIKNELQNKLRQQKL